MTIPKSIKIALCSASPAHVVAVMTLLAAGESLWADDLPQALLAAATTAQPMSATGSECDQPGERLAGVTPSGDASFHTLDSGWSLDGNTRRSPQDVQTLTGTCLGYAPVRVLDYGAVQRQPNGIVTVVAAILFHAEAGTDRAMTLSAASTHPELPLPWAVRYVAFRKDRAGWRRAVLDNDPSGRARPHIEPGAVP